MTQEGIVMVIDYTGTANTSLKKVAYYYNTKTWSQVLNGHYTISHTTVQTSSLCYQTVGLTVHYQVSTMPIPLGHYVQLINMAAF